MKGRELPCAQKLTAISHNYQDNRSKQEGGGTVVTPLHAILPTASGDFATVSGRRSLPKIASMLAPHETHVPQEAAEIEERGRNTGPRTVFHEVCPRILSMSLQSLRPTHSKLSGNSRAHQIRFREQSISVSFEEPLQSSRHLPEEI